MSQTRRNHSERKLEPPITQIYTNTIAKLNKADNINLLPGWEGAGSAACFGFFNLLIRAEGFVFQPRHRFASL
ncbi:CRISPR-associated endonuclease Cas1 [Microcoleus sp. LEGE 07076]|uniref:CRISPR-associated endonuclease Cas1 n=1 Tax=Microcoleus sp. LEGE 07076 TaxID=915322 RepID=UPI0021066B1E|nr:CRISPR-associated endonuclease Cas1 [Microcoleus sp. LEGE 07076]